jgi:hypothetical protein
MIQKDVALQYYVKICLKNLFKTKFIEQKPLVIIFLNAFECFILITFIPNFSHVSIIYIKTSLCDYI